MTQKGDRIELVYTNDRYTDLKPGDQGTVTGVNTTSLGTQIFIKWDSGSGLMLVPETGDRWKVIHGS